MLALLNEGSLLPSQLLSLLLDGNHKSHAHIVDCYVIWSGYFCDRILRHNFFLSFGFVISIFRFSLFSKNYLFITNVASVERS